MVNLYRSFFRAFTLTFLVVPQGFSQSQLVSPPTGFPQFNGGGSNPLVSPPSSVMGQPTQVGNVTGAMPSTTANWMGAGLTTSPGLYPNVGTPSNFQQPVAGFCDPSTIKALAQTAGMRTGAEEAVRAFNLVDESIQSMSNGVIHCTNKCGGSTNGKRVQLGDIVNLYMADKCPYLKQSFATGDQPTKKDIAHYVEQLTWSWEKRNNDELKQFGQGNEDARFRPNGPEIVDPESGEIVPSPPLSDEKKAKVEEFLRNSGLGCGDIEGFRARVEGSGEPILFNQMAQFMGVAGATNALADATLRQVQQGNPMGTQKILNENPQLQASFVPTDQDVNLQHLWNQLYNRQVNSDSLGNPMPREMGNSKPMTMASEIALANELKRYLLERLDKTLEVIKLGLHGCGLSEETTNELTTIITAVQTTPDVGLRDLAARPLAAGAPLIAARDQVVPSGATSVGGPGGSAQGRGSDISGGSTSETPPTKGGHQ